jgi:hypothetical protein
MSAKVQENKQQSKKGKGKLCTFSSSRHRLKPLNHGVLSQTMLFLSIS